MTRNNIFWQKLLFFLKTYSDSSLNTKYEGITRKTVRDSLKIGLKSHDFLLFPLWILTGPTMVNNENHGISDLFSSYLAQFFELYLHIWYSGRYLNMFSGNIKVFIKKYFFVSRGRFWIKMWAILVEISAWNTIGFWPKSANLTFKWT